MFVNKNKRDIMIIDLPPSGTNNAYHTNKGRWYKDKEFENWEIVQLFKLKKYKRPDEKKQYIVNIDFYFQTLSSDIDGRIKFCLDLLAHAGFYKNDNRVFKLIVTKNKDKDNPRAEISVD